MEFRSALSMKTFEILNDIGENREAYFGAMSPPIIQSANFCYNSVDEMKKALANEFDTPVYSRGNNPTVEILRKKLAALEKTEDALVFASGCAAITSTILSLIKSGDHIISVSKPYSWTDYFFSSVLPGLGLSVDFVDGRDIKNFENSIKENTGLIYLESPNSITFEIQDLQAVSRLAKAHDIITLIDNSYCTPLHQNPAEHGIDLVLHSASKYLSGHSDMVAGVVCGSGVLIRKIFSEGLMMFGGIISPHEAWMMIRGLRTLSLRLEKSTDSALKLMDYLKTKPMIKSIIYPYVHGNEQFDLANRQMKAGNGMFSLILDVNDEDGIIRFCENLKLIKLAVSWGGYESLAFPAITMNGQKDIPWNLIRFYIGLEDPESIIEDFENALKLN